MTAEVKERHRRAVAEAYSPTGKRVSRLWEDWVHGDGDDSSTGQALQRLAQRFADMEADAEERGRMEERARCLANVCALATVPAEIASDMLELIASAIKAGSEPRQQWLDAARKELEE